MSKLTVTEALNSLGLTRLTHFTPARSLWHIARDGQILSSKDLADNAPDYFAPTDVQRFDRHPDKVCCNFEYPNGYYLSFAQQASAFVNYPDWVCLLLDAELLLRPGTLFSGCNAAKGSGAYLREGGQALLDCYAQVSHIDSRWSRGPNHHPGAATDLQAEALVPGPISVSHVRGVVVPHEALARQLYGDLDRHGLGPQRFPWLIAEFFFDRNTLSSRVRYGGTMTETTWAQQVDQESS